MSLTGPKLRKSIHSSAIAAAALLFLAACDDVPNIVAGFSNGPIVGSTINLCSPRARCYCKSMATPSG